MHFNRLRTAIEHHGGELHNIEVFQTQRHGIEVKGDGVLINPFVDTPSRESSGSYDGIKVTGNNPVIIRPRVKGANNARYCLNLDWGKYAHVIGSSLGGAVTALVRRENDAGWITGSKDFTSSNSGRATISSGSTSVAVSHGLDDKPDSDTINVTPETSLGNATEFWVDRSNISASDFVITVDQDPTQNVTFSWNAWVQGKLPAI